MRYYNLERLYAANNDQLSSRGSAGIYVYVQLNINADHGRTPTDGDEVDAGSNPLEINIIPDFNQYVVHYAAGKIISIENNAPPPAYSFINNNGVAYSVGSSLSVQNEANSEIQPFIVNSNGQAIASGEAFSTQNTAPPVIEQNIVNSNGDVVIGV